MVETNIQDIISNPRGFVFSDPENCGPCRSLESRFKDYNFPWVKFSLKTPDKEVFDFIKNNNLEFMGIPRYIDFNIERGFHVSNVHPGKIFDDALFEHKVYGTNSKGIL